MEGEELETYWGVGPLCGWYLVGWAINGVREMEKEEEDDMSDDVFVV